MTAHSIDNTSISRTGHYFQHHHINNITPVLPERWTHKHHQSINSIIQNIGIRTVRWIYSSSDQSIRIDRIGDQSIWRIILNGQISTIHQYTSINNSDLPTCIILSTTHLISRIESSDDQSIRCITWNHNISTIHQIYSIDSINKSTRSILSTIYLIHGINSSSDQSIHCIIWNQNISTISRIVSIDIRNQSTCTILRKIRQITSIYSSADQLNLPHLLKLIYQQNLLNFQNLNCVPRHQSLFSSSSQHESTENNESWDHFLLLSLLYLIWVLTLP